MTGKNRKFKKISGIFLIILLVLTWTTQAQIANDEIQITADFSEKELAPNETVSLNLSRDLTAKEGRLAVFVNDTDLTSLFKRESDKLVYTPALYPLPIGENLLKIYLISPANNWQELKEFPLIVKNEVQQDVVAENETVEDTTNNSNEADELQWEFTPNVSLNLKGQNQTLTFPQDSVPERNPFTDLAGQGNILFKVSKSGWTLSNQFDFAGSSFKQEALRFGDLQDKAPRIDLSSYIIELSKGRFKFNFGHVSFGSNRHLLNSFSSRGFTVKIPIGKQNDFTFAAANGTSIVGYGNFLGLTRKKHSIISGTFAREFVKERPGGLRLEFSVMRGSLLPLTNFNQGEINDAEKSLGFGFRILGSDKNQRLRYEAGFTRSRFTNPHDPNLEQGFNVTEIRPETKNAYYGEISFDFLRGLKLWKEKKLKLTGTYRREEIQPLFRSIGAFSQADRRKNQFEITGNFGEINFGFGNLRERDNLADIASILKTLSRRNNIIFGIPLNSFFTPEKPIKWLPMVSYTFDVFHQFGAFLPTAGLFTDASQVPDQKNYNQAFNAQWMISDKISIGYVFTRAFQDNRQTGRENADFLSVSNGVNANYKPFDSLGLDFDLSRESQKSFEQNRIDRTFRFGTRANWQTPFLKNSVFSGGFSLTFAGDKGNLNDTRNGELDAQWAYNFSFGEKKFKKISAQFFIRYANRYGDTIDRQFFFNTINKSQTFNAGLTFNFF